MVDFLTDENGAFLVDEIVRYEDCADHLKAIGERLGVPGLGQRHIQSAAPSAGDYARHYTDWSRDMIGQLYEQDISTFGYTFD